MLGYVACSMHWINNWQVQSFCTLDSHRTGVKTPELVPAETTTKTKVFDLCEKFSLNFATQPS